MSKFGEPYTENPEPGSLQAMYQSKAAIELALLAIEGYEHLTDNIRKCHKVLRSNLTQLQLDIDAEKRKREAAR